MPVPLLALADRAGFEKSANLLAAVGNVGGCGNLRVAVRAGRAVLTAPKT